MGRVGTCGNNAAIGSIFSLRQKNILDTRRWHTREDLRLAIVTWIETKYHRKRRQRRLGKLSHPGHVCDHLHHRDSGLKPLNPR
jgi:putative transposase